jgi:multicomponent Na+:H+ antiporter subunit C
VVAGRGRIVIVVNYVGAAVLFVLGLSCTVGRRNLVRIVLGLSLMEDSTYLLLVSMAYRNGATAPVLAGRPSGRSEHAIAHGPVSDPVLQNFCLTAVVIGVAVTAVFLAVVVRSAQHYRSLDAADLTQLRG